VLLVQKYFDVIYLKFPTRGFDNIIFYNIGYKEIRRSYKISDAFLIFFILHNISSANLSIFYPLNYTKGDIIARTRVHLDFTVQDDQDYTLEYDGYIFIN